MSARARSTTKRLRVGPLRGRSRRCIRGSQGPGSGSIPRSVARASYRRKTHRTVHSPRLFTEQGRRRSWLERSGLQSSARAAHSHERATGVSEARSYEATSANTRGQTVRSGGSGRRRRETSCPSIHRAPGLIPRGREIGREPRARVQVDRLVGWQKSVGHIAICVGRSQPGGSHEDADACSRWRQGEPVCHAFHGTLQIREKQTT